MIESLSNTVNYSVFNKLSNLHSNTDAEESGGADLPRVCHPLTTINAGALHTHMEFDDVVTTSGQHRA